MKEINRNKKFWATGKPLFSNKMKVSRKHFLDESGEIIRNGFNRYFVNMVPSMGITINQNFLGNTNIYDDPLGKIIYKYKKYPRITWVNKHMIISKLTFTFQPVTKNQISKLMKLLNDKRAIQSTDIRTKLMKEFSDFFSEFKTQKH